MNDNFRRIDQLKLFRDQFTYYQKINLKLNIHKFKNNKREHVIIKLFNNKLIWKFILEINQKILEDVI